MRNRTSSAMINYLGNYEIFVFGSNESGIHGGGAARLAYDEFGARMGLGFGISGKSFALPTKSWGIKSTLPLTVIQFYVDRFIEFAKDHPKHTFLVTEVGCGIAGLTPKQVAPLFKKAVRVKNIHLPATFWAVLKPKKKDQLLIRALKALKDDFTTRNNGGFGIIKGDRRDFIDFMLKKYKEK